MNLARRVTHMFGALALVGSVASQAFAGNCISDNRTLVNGDSLTVSCKSATGTTHSGVGSVTVVGATKTIIANKTAGAGLNIVVKGLDNGGNTLCQVADSAVDGVTVSGNCNAAVKWNVTLVYNN